MAGGKPSQTTAGVPTGDRTAQFQNLSGSAKAAFIARVTACIRPNIIFNVPSGIRPRPASGGLPREADADRGSDRRSA